MKVQARAGRDPDATSLESLVAEGLAASRRRAAADGRLQYLAVRLALPAASAGFDALAFFARGLAGPAGFAEAEALTEALSGPDDAPEVAADGFYWEQPEHGHARVARGVVVAIEAEGPERFAEVAARARSLVARLRVVGDLAPADTGPCLYGGFGFASAASDADEWQGYPAARLVLPRLQLVRTRTGSFASVVSAIGPDARLDDEARGLLAQVSALRCAASEAASADRAAPGAAEPFDAAATPEFRTRPDRPHAHYRRRVAMALDAIAAGDLEKVVVARSVGVSHEGPVATRRFLEALRSSYPTCVSFAVARGQRVFLGATPERLVRLADGRVETGAVAGSAPRGASPERDEALGRGLRESKKEQAEHAVVVRAIRSALEPLCGGLKGPETPRLLRVDGIQHLETPLVGQLEGRADVGILELVSRLHPTPAVGGEPREAALAWIDANEGLDRGWYAGPVGYVDPEGGGEFRVALRSGLVDNGRGEGSARLYAGSGIVLGSDPEQELRETRLKLRALLSPLMEI